jgi:hypothetical protein
MPQKGEQNMKTQTQNNALTTEAISKITNNRRKENETSLDAKVQAQNTAAFIANELYPVFRGIFEPMVGQKVLKADGSLIAKIEAQLPKIQNIQRVQVYRQSTQQNLYWSLCWAVKVSCTVKNRPFCEYQEVYITVGSLDDGVLVELVDETDKKRDDYDVNDIRRLQEVYRVKMKEAREAERALYPFRYND